MAVFAGGNSCEGDELSPAVGRAGGVELGSGGAEVFLGMECAFLAGGEFPHQIENGAGGVAQLTVARDDGSGLILILCADAGFGFVQQGGGLVGLHFGEMVGKGERLGVGALALSGGVESADDEAGGDIAGVAYADDVAPGVGGVGSVDTDGVAMATACGLVGVGPLFRAAGIVEGEHVGGEGDGLTDGLGRKAFGEGAGGGLGCFLAGAPEDDVGEGEGPCVVAEVLSVGLFQEFVFIEESGEYFADGRVLVAALVHVVLDFGAIADGLSEEAMAPFLACEFHGVPGAPGEDNAVDVHFVFHGELEVIEGLADGAARE